MKGCILINAYAQSNSALYQPKRLEEELSRLGTEVQILRNTPSIADRIFNEFDFCVYLDKDKYCARALDGRIRLFNRAKAIEICDDKMLTHLALAGFPMPQTIAGVLCYTENAKIEDGLIDGVIDRLGLPVVVKECYGSLGKGVFLAKSREELARLAEKVKMKPHLFQKFIGTSFGKDVRVIVIGGKAVAAMLRTSDTDFRSNAALGGKGEPYPLSEEGKVLCEAVAKRIGLDYCGIDLLFGKDGFLVCEVNSNAFFERFESVTGINVAKRYAEYILKERGI